MKKTRKQERTILLENFLWICKINIVLSIAIFPCYGQKVIRLSDQKFITPTSVVKKIIVVDNNFFTIINNQLIKFKVNNDNIVLTESIENNVKDFIQNSEKNNSLFLLTDNEILSLNTDNMSVSTHCSLVNILDPEKLKSITHFEIDKNSLWLLKEFDFLEKIQLTENRPMPIKEKYTPKQKGIIGIKFYKNKSLKLLITQGGIYRDGLNNLFFSDGNPLSKPVIKLSKLGFYIITTLDGNVYATGQEGIMPHILQFKSTSANVRDVYHDTDKHLFWVAGADLKVFHWHKKNILLHLNHESKPAFASVQAETICPIPGTTKTLIGTSGSGIFLVEYTEKDSSNTTKPDTPKPPIKLIEKKFMLKNFEKDNTTLSPLDMLPFFNDINKAIAFSQVEIKKIKIEGHASQTGKGSDKAKTKETSQKRINFVRQKLVEKYKIPDGIFEEYNYGDEKPIDKINLGSSKNRAVVVIFEYEFKK